MAEETGMLNRGDGVGLAWARLAGRGPTIVFFPGFNSDMAGSKASLLAAFCAARGRAYVRFDYSGHGRSGGAFADGTIGRWRKDALAVIDRLTTGRVLLVGSSMGGWIALLVALARQESAAAIVGIAPAPDFTEDLMWEAMAPAERKKLLNEGHILVPNPYGAPYPVARALIEEGRQHLLLRDEIALECPVRLLHGLTDRDVPWETSLRIARRLRGGDVRLCLVKDGDHRLSRPEDLLLLEQTLGALLDEYGA